jgi:p21-activated kinase 1
MGLCTRLEDGIATGMAGTPNWMAPEMMCARVYGPKVDVWGIGVICFVLARGELPFIGKTPIDTMYQIGSTASIDISKSLKTSKYTVAFVKFLEKSFQPNPEIRATTDELLRDMFLKKQTPQKQIAKKLSRVFVRNTMSEALPFL